MLYNCIKCCRSISSHLEKCPYCNVDASEICLKLNGHGLDISQDKDKNKNRFFYKIKDRSVFGLMFNKSGRAVE